MTMNNKVLGNKGEEAAAAYLENHGYTVRERNYRSQTGEIDIIASRGRMMVFVEVKTRGSLAYGMPSEAVNIAKQRKIIRRIFVIIVTILHKSIVLKAQTF